MNRIKLATVVLVCGRRDQRALEFALFQIESKYLVGGADEEEVARRVQIVKVAAKLWNSYFVVFAVLSVKFDVAVVVKKHRLRIVLGQEAKLDALGVKATLELHRVLTHVKAFHPRLVDAFCRYS